jgi:adenylate cyclase class 2
MEHRNSVETEVKLRLSSLEGCQAGLEALGFRLTVPAQAEVSTLWDHHEQLLEQGSALRLRRYAGKAWLTWKGPRIPDALLKIRPELETEVANAEALEGILRALGFVPVMCMTKTRALMFREDLVACLDDTPFGCFLELEGEPPAIHAAMEALHLGPECVEPRSYSTLFREHELGS